MCHRPRPLRVGNPKLFLRLPLLRSSSHRHARSLRTSALDYARNFTSESRLSPRTASWVCFGDGFSAEITPVFAGILGHRCLPKAEEIYSNVIAEMLSRPTCAKLVLLCKFACKSAADNLHSKTKAEPLAEFSASVVMRHFVWDTE